MTRWANAKIRDDETWEAVRREWEAGETASSLARRYDVGLANLWRRRASDGWERGRQRDPTPEPAEGWDAWADRRLETFVGELEGQRELALGLLACLNGGRPEDLSLWQVGFYCRWRAATLGEAAAGDWERLKAQDWAGAVWDADGRLWSQAASDHRLIALRRDDWRRQVGLPEGAAPAYP